MNEDVFLTPDLARAARAFTKVSVGTIAKRADLTRDEVRGFEQSRLSLQTEEKARLKESLEHFGAMFIDEDDQGGYGVRRKYPREGFMRLNTWEGEGGQPKQ